MNKKVLVAGIIAGFANLVVGMVLNQIYNFLAPSLSQEYLNSALFRPWNDPLMSLYFAYPFVLGIVLAWFWNMTKALVKGNSEFEKAYKFGFVYWLIAGLPGMFITYSSFPVTFTMILAWSVSGLVEAVVAGFVFVKMLK